VREASRSKRLCCDEGCYAEPASADDAPRHKSRPRIDPAGMEASRPHPVTSLYVVGPFSMGYVDFYTFLIPLYGLSLGLDASEIGILVGARSILAMFLSIHIGALMDRIGTRKVTLFFVWTGCWHRCFRWCRGSGRCSCCNLLTVPRFPSPGRVRRP
jgi:hypothetical protein